MRTDPDTDLGAMRERAGEASRLLKALGNAQRLRVLCLLLDREMSVSQINEQLPDLSQSALSQHLARLRDEGLVSTRRESQTIWYTLDSGPTERIISALYAIYCADANQAGVCAPADKPTARKRARQAKRAS